MHRTHAPQAGCADGAAVVGVLAADDCLFIRLLHQVPIAAHQAYDRVIRLGSGAGKKTVAKLCRAHLAENFGQLDGRRMGALEKTVVVGQRLHLLISRVDEFLPAVADIDAP